jgi:hypothetical protein
MGLLPWGMVEQALRLVNLLLESTDPAQRRAQLLLWWNLWWPFWKLFLSEAQRKQIEEIMVNV